MLYCEIRVIRYLPDGHKKEEDVLLSRFYGYERRTIREKKWETAAERGERKEREEKLAAAQKPRTACFS